MDQLPSTRPFPMPHSELRKLVRRVTVLNTATGEVTTLDTLAHVNRQVNLGSWWDNPVREYEVDGVRFKHRGQTEFDIKVAEVPEPGEHEAWDILDVSEDGTCAAII